MALSLACLVVGVLGFLLIVTRQKPSETEDGLSQIWHRYEEGDITLDEFERLRRGTDRADLPKARAAQTSSKPR